MIAALNEIGFGCLVKILQFMLLSGVYKTSCPPLIDQTCLIWDKLGEKAEEKQEGFSIIQILIHTFQRRYGQAKASDKKPFPCVSQDNKPFIVVLQAGA
ncbi:hypothetical protein TNCV_3367101 [Trichonephila clavipes]|nr:hypothetical protein TNCV_3367101 [Trichonephila clavipes]